jgi:hypothetical protein
VPVEAPEGTAASQRCPLDVVTSTATVGFPRESRISRACTFAMVALDIFDSSSWARDPAPQNPQKLAG